MPRIKRKYKEYDEFWDWLEEELNRFAESKLLRKDWLVTLSIGILISAGREADKEWVHTKDFDVWCNQAYLKPNFMRTLILFASDYMEQGKPIDFDYDIDYNMMIGG